MIYKIYKRLYLTFRDAAESFLKQGTLRRISFEGGTTSLWDCVIALRAYFDKHMRDGKDIRKFEEAFADYIGARYAYSFSGGRVSLSAILYALDIGFGDEVILPGYTCVVVPNALIYRGIKPVYADIDPNTFNIDLISFSRKITRKTRAVILQYTYGLVPHIAPLLNLAKEHSLKVIEDCAHALGAEYKGQKVGTFGDAAFFSMQHTKVISTDAGGVAVTNKRKVAAKLEEFQRQCEFPSSEEIRRRLLQLIFYNLVYHPVHAWWTKHLLLPFLRNIAIASTTAEECQCIQPTHYEKRFPNALARIGLNQLKKLPKLNEHRIMIARAYEYALKDKTGTKPTYIQPYTKPVFLRYPLWVDDKADITRRGREHHIQIGEWFSSAIHPDGTFLEKVLYEKGECPVAEQAVKHVINLPTHKKIKRRDTARILNMLEGAKGQRGQDKMDSVKTHENDA